MTQKTIVLIDDDEDELAEMAEALSNVDGAIKCIPFIYANEAMQFLGKDTIARPDYIFINLTMPCLNGMECLMKLRACQEFHSVPIAIFSTLLPDSIAANLLLLGATYVFQKPDDYKNLVPILHAIISRAGVHPGVWTSG